MSAVHEELSSFSRRSQASSHRRTPLETCPKKHSPKKKKTTRNLQTSEGEDMPRVDRDEPLNSAELAERILFSETKTQIRKIGHI